MTSALLDRLSARLLNPTAEVARCAASGKRAIAALLVAAASALAACGGGGGAGETNAAPVSGVSCVTGTNPAVLTWDAVAGASGYRLYYGTANGTYPQSIDVGNVTTYSLTGLAGGVTYYFVATAYDSSSPPVESGFSNAVCKTIS